MAPLRSRGGSTPNYARNSIQISDTRRAGVCRLFSCRVWDVSPLTLLETVDALEVARIARLEGERSDGGATASTFPATGEAWLFARDRNGTAAEVIAWGWLTSDFREVWDVRGLCYRATHLWFRGWGRTSTTTTSFTLHEAVAAGETGLTTRLKR